MSDPDKILPLDQWHRAHGARMVPFAGYAMPVQYEGIIAEHRWTRESASLFDVSHMGQIRVRGEAADRALERLLPSDLVGLPENRLRYALLPNAKGGIIDDLIVTRRADHFYLVVNGATKEGDLVHLRKGLGDLSVEPMEDQALLALQGPRAAAALARLAPGVEDLAFMTAAAFRIGPDEAWISRSGYTGEDGFEISLPASAVANLADRLLAEPEVKPAGLGARDSLRLEAGLPLYGHDMDAETSPIEAGLGFAIARRRRSEGGFPGAARILDEIAEGPRLRRVGVRIEGRQPVREGALVVDGQGEPVGRVTSGGHAPSLEAPIAMAYVPASLSAPGTALRLSQRERPFAGHVVAMPFVPHRYHRKETQP